MKVSARSRSVRSLAILLGVAEDPWMCIRNSVSRQMVEIVISGYQSEDKVRTEAEAKKLYRKIPLPTEEYGTNTLPVE